MRPTLTVIVHEAAAGAPTLLSETTTLADATTTGVSATGRLQVQVISPGWGSSGYYPAAVLEAAGQAQVFPKGTHMYLDHPSYSEAQDRPERSVKDLAAVLSEDAHWDAGLQALVAEAEVFGPYREVLTEMADVIGVSIRASATVEQGEAEGRKGTIVSELVEGVSVDFVTRAGRGGRILSVLESARPTQVIERAVSHGVTEATANDTREALQNALRDMHTGDGVYVWVRDFDDTTVWYELETPETSGTYQHAYTLDDGGAATITGDPVEVTVRTQYVPVAPAGQSTTTTETLEVTMPTIEEARLRQLEADAGRVQTLESERDAADTRAGNAEQRLAEATARAAARRIATTIIGESITLPPSTRTRLVESALRRVPLTDQGVMDETAFRAAVEAARTTSETELAEALAEAGVGRVRGHGSTDTTGGDTVTEAALDADIADVFGIHTAKEA